MLWLTWRQFRAPTIVATAALALTALVLGLDGVHIVHLYHDSGIGGCQARGDCPVVAGNFLALVDSTILNHLPLLFGTALVAVPAVIGMFWGAPLLTRELESGTHRLAWSQGVTRTRWLAVNLAVIGLASMAAAGLFSLMVTWSASPIDAVSRDWLLPQTFSERGIVPVGYAAFAFALGVCAGMLIRHTVAAMAVTLAVFTAVQFAMRALRRYLIPPVHLVTTITALNGVEIRLPPHSPGQLTFAATASVPGEPGAWILASQTVDAAGRPAGTVPLSPAGTAGTLPVRACGPGTGPGCLAALHRLGYRQLVTYQPASRFWAFQWYETAIFVILALALAGICLWRIRRVS